MLFCKKCRIEYEDDRRFCGQCGSFLIKKEETLPDFGDTEKSVEEKPKEKFICPDCKIIYEKTKACIRCGAEVVLLTSFQTKEEFKTDQEPDVGKESSQVLTAREWLESPPQHLICSVCKKEHLGGQSCIRCGAALVPPGPPQEKERPRPPRPLEAKKAAPKAPFPSDFGKGLSQDKTPDQKTAKTTVEEQIKQGRFVRKTKKDYPRIFLNWSGIAIICIAAGYLFWSTHSHIVTKKSDSSAIPPSEEQASSPAPASSGIPPSISSPIEAEEIEKIRNLLENIRKANLRKDIDLFLSCYSNDFKDREGKKKSTLESWENFNFLDLTYALGNPSLSGDIARARVEWLVRFSPKSGGPPQESKTILDVVFKKEDATWKIGEIKSSL
ncbi:MAG: nuclear transport factor 2 family protein [Deltaproteobacteria bacterium]|nr:nuclear transport factor 2 family protein [Deltaproteobacteria bacterium]